MRDEAEAARECYIAVKELIREGYGVEDIAVRRSMSVDVVRDVVAILRRRGELRVDPPEIRKDVMAESNRWPEEKNWEFVRRWNSGENRGALARAYKLKSARDKARNLYDRGYPVDMEPARVIYREPYEGAVYEMRTPSGGTLWVMGDPARAKALAEAYGYPEVTQ